MGAAILDYQKSERVGRLRVLSSMFEEDEMPVKHLFRKVEEMPMLEQKALLLTKGRVLDIGAGSGCHTLALQEKNGIKASFQMFIEKIDAFRIHHSSQFHRFAAQRRNINGFYLQALLL